MSTNNYDIMQDFLIEAGEYFEELGEQLVDLEQNPNDNELLNAIFRAFHTIKGGAGFLNLSPMVETCHVAEDVFNLLRQGEKTANAEMIDLFLRVLDVLGEMFDQLREGEDLSPADPALIGQLANLLEPDDEPVPTASVSTSPEDNAEPHAAEEKTEQAATMDEEFEALLDAAEADSGEEPVATAASDDLITDDEFEDLLDQLHGKNQPVVTGSAVKENTSADADTTTTSDSDLITDDEFEAVLDKLHGKNKAPGGASTEKSAAASPAAPANAAAASAAKRKDGIQTETSVRVDTARLDDIMNLVGELVLVRNRLSTLKLDMKQGEVAEAISNLELVTSDLQSSVMKTRMQPIKKVFNRFPRVIRDLARQLDKEIDLELYGEDTDLDKNLVEALADPLIHLVRNAVDHGIESPKDREAIGKPGAGKVILSAIQEGDQILLSVSDDGKGMDADVLRRKAVEKGVMDDAAANRLTDNEAFNLIFAPGFSTKAEVSDVSGRGVGMDVVKTRITELNGNVEINSTRAGGTTITIRLPLTLAIMPTLMVTLGDRQFALPLANVQEAINLQPENINMVDGQEMLMVRDKPLPLYYLNDWFVSEASNDSVETRKVIVVQMGNQRFCMVVDDLIGQEEVVIKPLSKMLDSTPGFTGATITGDGGIALIFDVPGLMNAYASCA